MKKSAKFKLAIYTSLFGDKEELNDPLNNIENDDTDLDISFICYTDSKLLKSKSWDLKICDDHFLPSDKFSRRVKTMPHKYLSEFKYSLFIDNTVSFKRLPNSTDLLTKNKYLFKLFMHSGRSNLFEEFLAVNGLGYDTPDNLLNLKEYYSKFINLSNVSPLSTNTVILREHNNGQVIKFGEIWWEHILNFSKRDQLSFDFIKLLTSTETEYFPGTKMDNELVHPQSNFSSPRVLANFDERKFAFMNNIEQKNSHTSKSLYLRTTPDLKRSTIYAKRNSNFSLISNLCFSGMTSRFSPRRNLDVYFSNIFKDFLLNKSNILFIFNDDQTNQSSFTDEEYRNFKKAVSIFLSDSSICEIILSKDSNYQLSTSDNLNKELDLVITLNCQNFLPKNCESNFFNSLLPFNPKFLFLSEASLDSNSSLYLYDLFIKKNSYKNISFTGYYHDVLDSFVENSVFYIS
jgi:hypothetical protein